MFFVHDSSFFCCDELGLIFSGNGGDSVYKVGVKIGLSWRYSYFTLTDRGWNELIKYIEYCFKTYECSAVSIRICQ